MDMVELTAGLKSRPFKAKPYAEISKGNRRRSRSLRDDSQKGKGNSKCEQQ